MPSQVIQWFPGHMAKTRRVMQESLGSVDMTIEVLDARIPASSRNPEIQKMLGQKPILPLLCKSSLADPAQTAAWIRYYQEKDIPCLAVDSLTGEGFSALPETMRALLKEIRFTGRLLENGTRVPSEVKAGDTVVFAKYSGSDVTLDGKDYIILRDSDILAVVED